MMMLGKVLPSVMGLLVGLSAFYIYLRWVEFTLWFLCYAAVMGWLAIAERKPLELVVPSMLYGVMSIVGYQIVVSIYRFRVGMTFQVVRWDRFIPALCWAVVASIAIGYLLSRLVSTIHKRA